MDFNGLNSLFEQKVGDICTSVVKKNQIGQLIGRLVGDGNQIVTNRGCGRLFAYENVKLANLFN